MSDFRFTVRGYPTRFRSPALTNAIKNLGALPYLMGRIGDAIVAGVRKNLNNNILHRRTSDLYNSWAWALEAMNAGWRLTIGSDVVYARIHEMGGWTGRGHKTYIPARKYVTLAIQEKQRIVSQLTTNYMARLFME